MSPTTTAPSSAGTIFDEELDALVDGLDPSVVALTRDLVAMLLRIRPDFVPRVRTGWRSVNFRHPRAGFVCGVFPSPGRVVLVFEHGRLLSDPDGLLEGDGSRVRYITLVPGEALPETQIALLLAEAVALKP